VINFLDAAGRAADDRRHYSAKLAFHRPAWLGRPAVQWECRRWQ
jgi:hypothetical protein